MDADLEPVCRCGTERIVIHGGYAKCVHCDGACIKVKGEPKCAACLTLSETWRVSCICCGIRHDNEHGRRKCESVHSS